MTFWPGYRTQPGAWDARISTLDANSKNKQRNKCKKQTGKQKEKSNKKLSSGISDTIRCMRCHNWHLRRILIWLAWLWTHETIIISKWKLSDLRSNNERESAKEIWHTQIEEIFYIGFVEKYITTTLEISQLHFGAQRRRKQSFWLQQCSRYSSINFPSDCDFLRPKSSSSSWRRRRRLRRWPSTTSRRWGPSTGRPTSWRWRW